VKARVGIEFPGGGGYAYAVTREGGFRITDAPERKRVGKIITLSSYPQAWHDLAASLDQTHPLPAPAAPTPPAPMPKPAAPPPPPEPGLLDRAIGTVESGLHRLRDGASAFWDRATSWMHGDSDPAPQGAASTTPAPATPTTVASSPTPSSPAAPAASGPVPAKFQAGVDALRTKDPTMPGDTLDLALSRATPPAGTETEYSLGGLPHAEALRQKELAALLEKGGLSEEETKKLTAEKAALDKKETKETAPKLAADLASGRVDVWRFYCSGLSVWTLAAAGYDVTKPLKAPDGKEYRGEIFAEVPVDAKGKPVDAKVAVGKKRVLTKTAYVTLKQLVDGEKQAVEIMTRAKLENKTTVEIKGTGYLTGEGLPEAGRGAAYAFSAAGIGTEIPQTEQKPGDFAQCRHTRKDPNGKQVGAGHAWQVAEVTASGRALFGHKHSPKPVAGNLEGWHDENVKFTITRETDPRLVGEHTVTAAVRVEAQDERAFKNKAADKNNDGGVQVTTPQPVPDSNPNGYKNYLVFYGRLGTSPWNGWTAATKESAAAAASAAATTPAATTPAATTPEVTTTPAATAPDGAALDTRPAATSPDAGDLDTAPAATKPAAPAAPAEAEPSSEPLQPGTPAGELTGGDERSV
jgi:hypothetical protein